MTPAIFFLALLSPLASAALSLFQKRGTIYFSVLALAISSACLIYLLFQRLELAWSTQWFSVGKHAVSACALLNSKTLLMSTLISVLSWLIHIYSLDYLKDDERIVSFFGNLGLFTFSMLGLAVSGNLLLTFCFWELAGFGSYSLIGHWRSKPQAAYAATQSFLVNRLADAGFIIALALLWRDNGSLEYSVLFERTQSVAAFTLLFIGVMGKSAQLPFSGWLLHAMEGPAPASALIHSATMVAAGVYLLITLTPSIPPPVFSYIYWVGTATCFLAGIGAFLSFDIKRILAYSTISQLGFMMIAIGNHSDAAFLHLVFHACIKAGLFLAVGIVIKMYGKDDLVHSQDIRKMGSLLMRSPWLYAGILVCLASLTGMPCTAGFASKEIILASVWIYESNTKLQNILAGVNIISVIITSLYSMRIVFYLSDDRKGGLTNYLPRMSAYMPFFTTIVLSYLVIPLFKVDFLPFSAEAGMVLSAYMSCGVILYVFLFKPRRLDKSPDPDFILEKLYRAVASAVRFIAAHALSLDRLIDKVLHLSVYLKVAFANMIGWLDKNAADGLVTLFAKTLIGFGQLIRAAIRGQVQSYLAWSVAFILLFILFAIFS